MTQASKHVKWCLNKAKKEIEECKKLGKTPKHRGLLKKEPNIMSAKKHITKAEHYLNATLHLKGEFSDIAVSQSFYAIYQCFLAIAAKFGYESANQQCTISLIEWLKEEKKIDFGDKFIDLLKYKEEETDPDNVIDMREEYTYGVKITVDELKIEELIQKCKEILDATKDIIYD